MTYLSGLMLGASIANMLRQSIGLSGNDGASAVLEMRGGRAAKGGALPLGGAFLSSGLMGSMPRALLPTGALDGHTGGGQKGSASRPKAITSAELPPFSCVHASPGRRRYRTPYLTAEFARVLERELVLLPFVQVVKANAQSGSILLTYLPEDEAHILVLAEGLQAIFAAGKTVPPATLAQSVRRSVHALSAWIQRNTGGALDLSSVVAGIFVLRGIRQLVLTNSSASGSQMLWWALTLMRGWKV